MSRNKFDAIANLNSGRYDYKIKSRITRLWRGTTKTGEEFKNFNIILLDEEKSRIHAFVPTLCAEDIYSQITVGKVYSIKNFTVQNYKPNEIFRCLRNDKQIIFSKDTKIEDIEGHKIPEDVFDFYDHTELKALSSQKVYLADVVGIIKKHDPFRNFTNKKSQAKFTITDGSSNINVTFWEKFGEMFEKDMMQQTELPVIIIISCCRVGSWNGQVDISNVGATKYYLNYKHHSVLHLRKLLKKPEFAKQIVENNKITKKKELLTLDAIKKLGNDYIESEVYTHVQITSVEETPNWCYNICTSCERGIKEENGMFICENCDNRIIPHPDKWYKLNVVASDTTGVIQIVLQDREVRTITGKRARILFHENTNKDLFPKFLKDIANNDYTIVLHIKEMNVVDKMNVYWATNICNNFVMQNQERNYESHANEQTTSGATTSTYHLQGISELNFQST